MDGNTAYIQVKQYVEQGQWKQAYDICKAVIADEDNYGASFDQAEEMALIQIQCLLKEINVLDFSKRIKITKDMDEDEKIEAMLAYNDQYSEIYDLLDDAIVDYFCFNGNEDLDVFQQYAHNIYNFLLPIYIEDMKNIMAASYEEPIDCYNTVIAYQKGVMCLSTNLMLSFGWAEERVGVENDIDFKDPNSDDFEKILRILKAQQAVKFSQEALAQTGDYPYFMDAHPAGDLFLQALAFCRESYKEELDTEKAIMRRKLFVNIACNFLNAFVVAEGQRFSMQASQKDRLELFAEINECVGIIQMYDKQYQCPPVNRDVFSTM